jgi:hypothetical protein
MAVTANGTSHTNGHGPSAAKAQTNGATKGKADAVRAGLTNARAEELIRLMTDGLVNIVDESGEFLLKCELDPVFVAAWSNESCAGEAEG